MDRLLAMRYFIATVESGSISAAARRLQVGQPTVSKTLAALESYLGARLLVRTTRSHALTDAGRRYLDHARIALDEVEEAEAAARSENASLSGWLRIAAAPVLAAQVVIPRLHAFRALHPDLKLDLVLDDRQIDLVAEGIDVALRAGDPGQVNLVGRRIASIGRVLVGSAEYLAQAGTPEHPDQLPQHSLISYTEYGTDSWRFERGDQLVQPIIEPALRVTAAEGLRACVLAGMGLAVASSAMFPNELADGRVQRVLPEWGLPLVDLWVLYPQGRRPSARASKFAQWMGEIGATLSFPRSDGGNQRSR